MKLHHLQIQALGPFGGRESIDFDALGAHGLFLMHGPTGSGKTSVLDAVCLAVFGAVPGSRRGQADRLMSDHAQPGSTPRVRLEFTVAGRRLRITRTPAHLAAKKRGSGHTRRQPSVLLEERRQGGWHAVSTRMDETAAAIDEVLGLGLEQFAQVVLLPQGEFAAFLHAKADDRAALLQRLFDITRFSDLEGWLQEQRRFVGERVVQADQAIQTTIVRAEESLVDHAAEIEQWRAAPVDQLPALIRATHQTVSDRLTDALAALDDADAASEAAQRAHDDAVVLERLQKQAVSAAQVWAAWEAGADERQALTATLDAHERALRVRPAQRAADRAAERLRAQQEDLALMTRTIGSEHGEDTDPADLLTALDSGQEHLARAVHAHAERQRCLAQLGQVSSAVRRAEASCRALDIQQAHLERRAAALADDIVAATEQLSQQPWHERRSAIFHEWSALADKTRRADEHLDRLRLRHQQVARQFARAEREALSLRGRRLDGIAGELALGLTPDTPCPVCGSCEHPAPAQAADAISQSQIDHAESDAAAARADLDHASADVAGAVATVATLTQQRDELAGKWTERGYGLPLSSTTAPEVEVELKSWAARLEDARRGHELFERQAQELRSERERADAASSDAAAALVKAIAEHDGLTAQQAAAQQALEAGLAAHHHECPCSARQEHLDVAATEANHRRLKQQLAAWSNTRSALDALCSEHAAAASELEVQLEANGFGTPALATAAVAQPAVVEQLRLQLTEAEASAQRARGVLDEPHVQAARAEDPVDLNAFAHARATAQSAQRAARDAFESSRRAAASLERLNTAVTHLVAESADDRAHLPVITRVADLASGAGDNALRMRLSAYVLAARLEQVTVLANHQLATMSAGRYQLEHTDARAKGSVRSGLGLQVRDLWTGTARDTATLSGGETFMASLALALALGEAVLHDAGGRPLQTLLVDEGFGSLDDESLELVMEVLDDLRSGGRTVGIVSHVSELRTRVPAQIRVRKTEQGSTVEVLVGDATSVA